MVIDGVMEMNEIFNPDLMGKMSRILAVARGDRPADLLIKGGRLVNVFNSEITETNLALAEGVIAAVGPDYEEGREVFDIDGGYLTPGLIDAHLHVESTLLLPPALARVIVAHGTTALIHDPHEIANVLGAEGVALMLAAADGLPCDFFATVPSCVPATGMETAGGEISAAQVSNLLGHPQVVGLGEVMNYPGVVAGDEAVLEKIIAARSIGKVIDGHAPALTGKMLQAYLGTGIASDHECINAAEALEKLKSGMKIIIRHGSATSSLAELLPLVNDANCGSFMFGSDDREVAELLSAGHVNDILRSAAAMGGNPLQLIKMATINPALNYRLYNRGALVPGYRADLVVFEDLENFRASLVIKDGRIAARDGRVVVPIPNYNMPAAAIQSVRLGVTINEESFILRYPAGRVPVIGIIPGQLVTEKLFMDVERSAAGLIAAAPGPDLNKIAVIERHKKSGRISVGLIRGLGLIRGALASTVAHDSHNIIVAGASEKAMAAGVNELARIGGGFVVTGDDGAVRATLPLPAAGLMSNEPAEAVAHKMAGVLTAAREMGTSLPQPFLTLSFMALPVIPSLKITDQGLVDVDNFTFLSPL